MPQRIHSTLILIVVFVLGISAGVCAMLWAWPAMRSHYFPSHRHETTIAFLQRTLDLTPGQNAQIAVVLKDTRARAHAIHLEFVPRYTAVCNDYMQIHQEERNLFHPLGEEERAKIHAVLSDPQWQKFQQQNAAYERSHPPRRPDLCRSLPSPAPPPPAAPAH